MDNPDKLKVCGFPMNIHWEQPKKNLLEIEQFLEAHPHHDLYILPEMFASGFSMNAAKAAEESQDVLAVIEELAHTYQVAICGSIAVEEKGKYYNRMLFQTPQECFFYDKKHLFSYSGEQLHYTAGTDRVIVEYKGWRILLQICYDLRFPVFSRNRNDYDAVIYVANWPEQRIWAWEQLLKARAIENQAYVAGINRTGIDGNGLNYPSSSYLLDYEGKDISTSSTQALSSVWDKEQLQKHREKFPFLSDADAF